MDQIRLLYYQWCGYIDWPSIHSDTEDFYSICSYYNKKTESHALRLISQIIAILFFLNKNYYLEHKYKIELCNYNNIYTIFDQNYNVPVKLDRVGPRV